MLLEQSPGLSLVYPTGWFKLNVGNNAQRMWNVVIVIQSLKQDTRAPKDNSTEEALVFPQRPLSHCEIRKIAALQFNIRELTLYFLLVMICNS